MEGRDFYDPDILCSKYTSITSHEHMETACLHLACQPLQLLLAVSDSITVKLCSRHTVCLQAATDQRHVQPAACCSCKYNVPHKIPKFVLPDVHVSARPAGN
jgi:hypothetical protein